MDGCGDVAIIGFSFLFPGADSTESLWDLMLSGECAASEFPADRLSGTTYHGMDESYAGSIRPQKAGFLKGDIAAFDAHFFGMLPDEASAADPQQRLLLETTYRALENAGIPLENIRGSKTSVHAGCFTADYLLATAKDPERAPKYTATGVAGSMLSNKISTFFDLTGPSLTLDTACSSSLVALDLACQCLRSKTSSMGIVAGCNLLLSPDLFITLSSLGFLSPDGVCHSFDNRANGYARGEGFAVLVVKRIDDAVRDGDTIRAVIRATGTNQNGRTPLAMPSKEMQTQLITDTYRSYNLDTSLTRFFEAHGTGTAVGDPLEAMAIGNVFGPKRGPSSPIVVGALKANIGHLEGAAGIAAVIRTILVLETGIIPPIADLQDLNAKIDAEFLNLEFPTAAKPWPDTGLRRASVNSFGFGGTNSHVVMDDAFHYLQSRCLVGNHATSVAIPKDVVQLREQPLTERIVTVEEAPLPTIIPPSAAVSKLFVWSANKKQTVLRILEVYRKHIANEGGLQGIEADFFSALAHTLAARRTLHSWRAFVVADSVPGLAQQLAIAQSPIQAKARCKAAFVFTGQGAQWPGMGRELLAFPVFRNSVMEAEQYLQGLGCPWEATDAILGHQDVGRRISEPRFAQPLCTILQIALVELLRSFGIYPSTVIGHSSGEIAAAYTVGAISRQSAWRLAYFRGLFSSELAELPHASGEEPSLRGSMMAVGLSEDALRPYVKDLLGKSGESGESGGVLVMACINSPRNTTLSGDEKLILAMRAVLDKEGVFARVLKVPVAYHSPHMLQIASSYRTMIGDLETGETSAPFHVNMVSSVTGEIIEKATLRVPEYWVRNMVSPVRFSDAMASVCRNAATETRHKLDLSHRNFTAVSDIVEIGPHAALQAPIRETMAAVEASISRKIDISYTPTLVRGRSATVTMLEAAGKLHCLGYAVDLARVNNPRGAPKTPHMSLTTLPAYPYDHSQTFWAEPRMSKNTRLPPLPYNEVLGRPVADWNPLEPRWRNMLSRTSIPWLQDHKINGEILFPAVGMLVMAVEAITLTLPGREIISYEIRDAAFLSALTIPGADDDAGVEVHFCLRPLQDPSDKANSRASFSLFASRSGHFVEICHGSIRAVLDFPQNGRSELAVAGDQKATGHLRGMMASAKRSYTSEVDRAGLYARLDDRGYQYGPTFQGIQLARRDVDIRNGAGSAVGDVLVHRPSPKDFGRGTSPLVIHPCTLDAILQLTLPAVILGETERKATWVPTYVSKMTFSAAGFARESRVQVHATSRPRGLRLRVSDIYALESGDYGGGGAAAVGRLQAEGIELTLVTKQLKLRETGTPHNPRVKRIAFDMVYKPDLTLLDQEAVARYVKGSSTPAGLEPSDLYRTLELYILASVARAAHTVSALGPLLPDYLRHQKQYACMEKMTHAGLQELQGPPGETASPDWCDNHVEASQFASLGERLQAMGRIGKVHARLGTRIADVLLGKISAPEVLAEAEAEAEAEAGAKAGPGRNNGPGDDYRDFLLGRGAIPAALLRYLDVLAHKDSALRLLEVGAGEGRATRHVLGALAMSGKEGEKSEKGESDENSSSPICYRFSQYDVTDASPASVDRAANEFGDVADTAQMRFRLLDAEGDVAGQGYQEHSYDVVVCTKALQTAKSLQGTLFNIRKLLRTGGKLILFVEATEPSSILANAISAYFDTWSQKEDAETWRQDGPVVTPAQWSEVLQASGFSGNDLIVHDFESPGKRLSSLLISSAVPIHGCNGTAEHADVKQEEERVECCVVAHWDEPSSSPSLLEESVLLALEEECRDRGIAPARPTSLREIAAHEKVDNACIVFVLSGTWFSLANLSAEQYDIFHSVLTRCRNILWLYETESGSGGIQEVEEPAAPPSMGAIQGLARTLRNERHGLVFATAALDPASSPAILSANVTASVRNFLSGVAARTDASYEPELVQLGDCMHIPRAYEWAELNRQVHELAADRVERRVRFSERNLRLKIRQPGLLDTLCFEEEERDGKDFDAGAALLPGEISVEVKAAGVNFRDCLIALARIDDDKMGGECAGIVSATGSACKLQVGDRVMITITDAFRSYIRCDERLAVKIPAEMTFMEAGALPVNFATAYHCLIRLARLSPGETVLIHSGAGGTGQAAIQVAKFCQARVFATVGSTSKAQLLTKLYDIPPDHIFDSRSLSFVEDVKRLTGGKGVDVVLNSLAGDALVASWESVAPYGRFVEIGKKDISRGRLSMLPFGRNISFHGFDLSAITAERPDLVQGGLVAVLDLFQRRILRMPSPLRSFPVSQTEAAFRHLQSGVHTGKVIIDFDTGDAIQATVVPRSEWRFSPAETFVISGGLGAVGLLAAQWMVSKGARHLILLSRSGERACSESVSSTLQKLRASGASVYAPPCSVANAMSLADVLQHCEAHMPPIKGCIQAAMVLQDSLFDNMTSEAWSTSLQPKIHGSWNLHRQLPRDLAFFVLLSSVAGVIGSQGQANYAVGNAFQDGLARYRLARGERAASVDLSLVAGRGWVAANPDAAARFASTKAVADMSDAEIIAVLDRCCCDCDAPRPARAQLVLGLQLPADMRAGHAPGWMRSPMFANLHRMPATEGSADDPTAATATAATTTDLLGLVRGAASLDEAADVAAGGLAAKLGRAMSLAETPDRARPLHTYGVDSLVAVELRNWVAQTLGGADLAVFEILGGGTLATLGRTVAEKVRV